MMISLCYRDVFVLLTAIALQTPRAAVSQGAVEDCWWTGCQLSAWLVTGCNQYHRTQKNVKTCTGGSEYYCCADVGQQQPVGDCWWTGCQLNEWQVKGCDNYNRTETDREQCPDGIKYKCCVGTVAVQLPSTSLPNDKCWWTGCQPNDWMVKGCDSYNRTETAREQCPNGFKYKCCVGTATVRHLEPSSKKEKCWWTDCQPKELVKSCESFNSTETGWEQCPEGIKYKCCTEIHETVHLPDPSLPKEDCWWTGCQLNEWLVKGCDIYNRTETAREQCPDGLKYKCCTGISAAIHLPDPSLPKEDCWWTGCQPNDWLVKGCDTYNRTEIAREQCPDGLKYKCCVGTTAVLLPEPSLPKEDCWWTGCQLNEWLVKGCDSYNRTETAREQCPDGLKYKCCTGISAAIKLPDPSLTKEDCWWTGCQLNEWLVKGCDSYNRTETAREQCPDGLKYKCCTGISAAINLPDPSLPKEDCWWTGCQLNEWLVKGCDSYNRTEMAREQCPDGLKYKCCTGISAAINLPDPSLPKEDCWWTGCQLNEWLVKGCDSYNRTEMAREQCPDGLKYKCCTGISAAINLPDPSLPKEDCWWTGCQLNEWLVKGCDSYNRTETAQEQCPDGLKYKCCTGISAAIKLPDPSLPKEDCWWTGCQLNEWLVKGCDSYNRTETAREQCPDGLKYKCCTGISAAIKLPDPSLPKEDCWWTGCQLNEWLVKGCDSYNRTETAREQCPDGLKYKCCTGISAAIKLPDPSLPKENCWWTGCQLNKWLVKGCYSYNRTEIEREQCPDGFKYKCCTGEAVVSPVLTAVTRLPNLSSAPEEKCWWTGCQLTKWNIRGCPSNTVQTGTHACPRGDLYQCCLPRKKSTVSDG